MNGIIKLSKTESEIIRHRLGTGGCITEVLKGECPYDQLPDLFSEEVEEVIFYLSWGLKPNEIDIDRDQTGDLLNHPAYDISKWRSTK